MRKQLKRALAVSVGALGAVAMIGGPAGAAPPTDPAFTPNNKVDWVRAGGSDTTELALNDLGELYNTAVGCIVQASPQPLDGTCIDGNSSVSGIQPQYQLDGLGNPTAGENTDRDVVFQYPAIGSSGGISQLAQRGLPGIFTIDMARSSRRPRTTDADGLRFVAWAKDAIPWVYFPGGGGAPDPVPAAIKANTAGLTKGQLNSIFSQCNIDLPANGGNNNGQNDWGDVGGTAGQPFVVWTANAASGTRSTWDTDFIGPGANSENCIPGPKKDNNQANGERRILENQAVDIQFSTAVDCDDVVIPGQDAGNPCAPNSIFYYSYGPYQRTGGETAILGCLNTGTLGSPVTVCPSTTTIENDTFTFSRFMWNAYRQEAPITTGLATNAVKNFTAPTGFLCRSAAQHAVNPRTGNNYRTDIENTIEDNGFIPLSLGSNQVPGFPNSQPGTSHCRVLDTNDV